MFRQEPVAERGSSRFLSKGPEEPVTPTWVAPPPRLPSFSPTRVTGPGGHGAGCAGLLPQAAGRGGVTQVSRKELSSEGSDLHPSTS